MGNMKKLYLLLGVLVLVCGAVFLVSRVQQHQEAIRSGTTTVLTLDTSTATALSWEYADNSFSFHKDDQWIYDADNAFPVDQVEIGTLLGQFEQFTADFTIEDAQDLSQYGLDDPTCTIHIETTDGGYDILLGDYSQMDQQCYVSIGDGNVYLVSSDPLDVYNVLLAGLIQNDETPDFDGVTAIRFTGADNYTVTYEENNSSTYSTDDVYFTKLGSQSLALDTTRVNSYLSTITYLNLTDYVTYTADGDALAIYGLDDPELTVSVDYTVTDEDGAETAETFTLALSRDPEQREKDDDDQDVTAYVRIGDSAIIYQITADEYNSLMAATRSDLRHQEILWANFTDIQQVDVTLEGQTYTLTVEANGDEHVWYYGEEKLSIGDFQSALTGLTAATFTTEQPSGKEELRLTVTLDNENVPSVEIAIYRYDGSFCLVTVDGTPTALVSRSAAMDLVEAVNAIVLN